MLGSKNTLVNGVETRCVDFADRGFQYGDGIFTTMLVSCGTPLFLGDHLDRLQRDSARLALPFPGREILAEEARLLSNANRESVLKIQLTRGAGGRGYRCPDEPNPTRVLSCHPAPDYPPELRNLGIRARLCRARLGINPLLAGVKHMNRLEQVLARSEWHDDEIREGLMLDQEGCVVEGVTSNLFMVNDGRLRTPRIDRCGVAGVMRSLVIRLAQVQGLAIEETRIYPNELYEADELFLTNCVIRLWPIRQFEGLNYEVGTVTRMMQSLVAAMIEEEFRQPCRG
ncbi:MAG TPA: aminodeoxychorismate lyase [Methylococcaceae bacterium]|jgi:4-amino-4-deoxychorismate lyase|nr:aminodeoxychorismate lyase [Methylococcaceae bacterium]